MKTKVLMYSKREMNKVICKNVELQNTDMKNIFTYHDGNESLLVFRYELNDNVVFVETSNLYENQIETQKDRIQEYYKTFLSSWKSRFASTLLIEAHKVIGSDIEPIIKEREKQLKERDDKQKEKDDRKQAEERAMLENDLKRANETVDKLKADKEVTFGDLMSAIDILKIEVHPRTKGAMLKQNESFLISKSSGTFAKGIKNATAQSMLNVVSSIAS